MGFYNTHGKHHLGHNWDIPSGNETWQLDIHYRWMVLLASIKGGCSIATIVSRRANEHCDTIWICSHSYGSYLHFLQVNQPEKSARKISNKLHGPSANHLARAGTRLLKNL